jgi:iron(III) transport system substrate-binding protein
MTMVVQAGLLAPGDTATLEQVAPAYRPSTGWIGIAARSTVFVYSKTKPVAPELLHSLLDLADPVWKGRWAASPTGGDFQAIVSGLLELKGEAATLAWLKAMKTNSVACRIGQTIVLVEQNLAATLALAQRVCILNNGHIVHCPAAEIKAQPGLLQRYLGV